MTRKDRPNLYSRHQNKRALQKKQRAKEKGTHNKLPTVMETDLQHEDDLPTSDELIGQIAGKRAGHYAVLHNGVVYRCDLDLPTASTLKPRAAVAVVGDKVRFRITTDEQGTVEAFLARQNCLARLRGDSTRFSLLQQQQQVVAANIDLAVIVASAASPKFHPSLIDRYLIICQAGNVRPLICLNKADLTDYRDPVLKRCEGELQIPVIETSNVTGSGLDRLKDAIRGQTVVLVGNSGVGKSLTVPAGVKTVVYSKTKRNRIQCFPIP